MVEVLRFRIDSPRLHHILPRLTESVTCTYSNLDPPRLHHIFARLGSGKSIVKAAQQQLSSLESEPKGRRRRRSRSRRRRRREEEEEERGGGGSSQPGECRQYMSALVSCHGRSTSQSFPTFESLVFPGQLLMETAYSRIAPGAATFGLCTYAM